MHFDDRGHTFTDALGNRTSGAEEVAGKVNFQSGGAMDEKEGFDRFRFLHERRMTFFNTRREHEWKILFGVVGLLLALDAAQLIYGVQISGWHRYAWAGMITVLVGACVQYEWGLQFRNFLDRRAMNTINNIVCRSLHLEADCPVFEREYRRWHGAWAFLPQLLFLGVVASISVLLPWLGISAARNH